MTFIKRTILIAAIAVGVFGAHDVYGDTFGVNPQGSYLLVDTAPQSGLADIVVPPLVLNLAALGVQPGDTITLTAGGEISFSCYPGVPGSCAYQPAYMCALFSSSDIINPPSVGTISRVPGALMPASNTTPCVTGPTLFDSLPTDIPQDFSVVGTPTTIPADAAFLIVAVPDTFYGDNASGPDGGPFVDVSITSAVPELGSINLVATLLALMYGRRRWCSHRNSLSKRTNF
jgi:hypothetical protein